MTAYHAPPPHPGGSTGNEVDHVRHHLPPDPPTPTSKKRIWLYRAAIPVALFAGIGLGHASGPAPAATSTAAPVTITVPAPAGTFADDARDNPAVPDPYLPNNSATATPTGPLTTFSDGIYEVGTGDGQIAPGKYKAAPSPDGFGYIHVKKANGGYGDMASGKGQLIVTITKADAQAEVYGCTFTKI